MVNRGQVQIKHFWLVCTCPKLTKNKKSNKIVKNRNNKSTKNDKQISDNISMGFCLAIPNIIFLISVLAYCKFLN